MKVRDVFLSSLLAAAVAGLALASPAPSRADGDEELVLEMVSVTGTLELSRQPASGISRLEIESNLMGRYRIDPRGLGAELAQHVGQEVTVVAYVQADRWLRVERFSLPES